MDNQHTQISGYRDLTQEEIDLMDEAKRVEAEVLAFHRRVQDHLTYQSMDGDEEVERQKESRAFRWMAVARGDIETGFMALVRCIAQPMPIKLDE